jgi:hypothetical protein
MQDEDFGIDMEEFSSQQDKDFESEAIDLSDYSKSDEAKEASWWDVAKDVAVQPALGYLKAFTWPADLLKFGMVQSALGDMDEIQERYRKEGKEFNPSDFIKSVQENYAFVPTQEALEKKFSEKTGFDLEPKSKAGKRVNQFFKILSLAKGGGANTAVKSAAIGTGATAALEKAGVSEGKAELAGDVLSGLGSLKPSPRQLSPEAAALEKTATKQNLPFPEYLARDKAGLGSAKITEARKAALQKQLGIDSEEAIQRVVEGKLPIAKLKNQGVDIELMKNEAYDKVAKLAKSKPKELDKSSIFTDIDNEISRIKGTAPSLSSDSKKSIDILERVKNELEKTPSNTEQMVNQVREFNREVRGIYRKPEYSGSEEAVRKTYAFLNDSVRNNIEAQSGKEIREAMRAADLLNTQVSRLEHAEALLEKAFVGGEYNPKKLTQLLNSSQGQVVRRELGADAIKDIREIAQYGDAAVKATTQLAKSSKYANEIASWGPVAGFVLAKIPVASGMLLAAKPAMDHVRGYLMTNPATRTVYKDILKNAAQGSFKNMQADFGKIEESITKQFGSVDNFMRSVYDDLEVVEGFD